MSIQLSNEFRQALLKEMIGHEQVAATPDTTTVSHLRVGWVDFITPNERGALDICLSNDAIGTSLTLFKDNSIAIVFNSEEFLTTNYMAAVTAHELGHFLSGHLGDPERQYLSLYDDEFKRTLAENDYDQHLHWSAKSIVDGGYLQKEFEADSIAVQFVGYQQLLALHFSEMTKANNLTMVLERFNRFKELKQRYEEAAFPAEGYSMAINLITTDGPEGRPIYVLGAV